MAKLRGVVLAAGRGVRMAADMPKALLPVRGNEPLLYYALKGLKTAGIDDLVVVTGYSPPAVQEFVGQHWDDEVQFVFNARYASWGNFHSLRMGLEQSPGFDVLAVNSDIVVPPQVYRSVAETPGDLVLAIQPRDDLDAEDMRARVVGGRVVAIGKGLPRGRGDGEFVGVSLLRPDASSLCLDLATDVQWRADTNLYYEDLYARMLGRVDARAALVEPGAYAEVDEWRDMEAAAAVIQRHRDAWDAPRAEAEAS